jgi:hypothetical protein
MTMFSATGPFPIDRLSVCMRPPRKARDLIQRLKDLPRDGHVLIALDGENPWDYYPNNGRDFLPSTFEGIDKEADWKPSHYRRP